MRILRRRLASCALAMVICHAALVFAAPLSSCCPSRTAPAAAAEKDCCPAGAHKPGECPLHARSKSSSRISCRMQCDAPHGAEFLVGAVGMLPAPVASLNAPAVSRSVVLSTVNPETRPFVPDSPPPRLS